MKYITSEDRNHKHENNLYDSRIACFVNLTDAVVGKGLRSGVCAKII